MKQLFILLTVLFICFCIVGCKDKKKAILESIIRRNVYEDGSYYRDGLASPQWRNYQEFVQLFSDKEIEELCENDNSIVRTYSFRKLVENRNPHFYKILLNHLSDTSSFRCYSGCLISEESVSDVYLNLVGYDIISDVERGLLEKKDLYLSREQYEFIDSVLLFGNEIKERSRFGRLKYGARELMLYRIKPLPKFHNRIAQLAAEGVYEVLPLLASYENFSDTSFLKSMLLTDGKIVKKPMLRSTELKASARNAITIFPDPCFYPILKQKVLEDIESNVEPIPNEISPLYFALVQYPTIETRKVIEKALQKINVGHYRRSGFIYNALTKYPSKQFDGLLKDVVNTTGNL